MSSKEVENEVSDNQTKNNEEFDESNFIVSLKVNTSLIEESLSHFGKFKSNYKTVINCLDSISNLCKSYRKDSLKAIKKELFNIGMHLIDPDKEKQLLLNMLKEKTIKKSNKIKLEFSQLNIINYKLESPDEEMFIDLNSNLCEDVKCIKLAKSIRFELQQNIEDFIYSAKQYENNMVEEREKNVENIMNFVNRLLEVHRLYVYNLKNFKNNMEVNIKINNETVQIDNSRTKFIENALKKYIGI